MSGTILLKLLFAFIVFLLIALLLALLFGIFIFVVQDHAVLRTPIVAFIPWIGSDQARTTALACTLTGGLGVLLGCPLPLVFYGSWIPDYSHSDNHSSDSSGWGSRRNCCLYCRHYFASPDSPGQCMLYHSTRLPGDDACNNFE